MRIRSIKPQWLSDERIGQLTDSERVLTIGLILMADDHGRGKANPALVRATVWPYGDPPETLRNITERLRKLAGIGFIRLYELDGQHYYEIRNWLKHQRISHQGKPIEPPPPELSGDPPETLRNFPETFRPDKDREMEMEMEMEKEREREPTAFSNNSKLTAYSVFSMWEEKLGFPLGDFETHRAAFQTILDVCSKAEGETIDLIKKAIEGIFDALAVKGRRPLPQWLAKDISLYLPCKLKDHTGNIYAAREAKEARERKIQAEVEALIRAANPPTESFLEKYLGGPEELQRVRDEIGKRGNE